MSRTLAEQFDREGWTILPGVVAGDTVRRLRERFLPIFRRDGVNVLHDAILHFPDIYDVFCTPALVEALTGILGENFVVPPYSSVTYNGFGFFHTDTTGAELTTYHKDPRFRILTVAIYLQDNNEWGGGIRLAPGSHREPDRYVELMKWKAEVRRRVAASNVKQLLQRVSRGRLYDWTRPFLEHPRGIDIPSKAGDVLMWDLRTAHRASPKRRHGEPPEGGKVAVFFNADANNPVTTDAYMKYVTSIAENEFLRRERPKPPRPERRAPFVIL
jgi:hypothetical protein